MNAMAHWIVGLVGLYVAVGLVFVIPFVLRGVNRIDPVAAGSTWGFRLIIAPGVVAFWPLMMSRWLRKQPPPRERNAHRDAAGGES